MCIVIPSHRRPRKKARTIKGRGEPEASGKEGRMKLSRRLCATSILVAVSMLGANAGHAAEDQAGVATVGEVVVTANKRVENVNRVGMSINTLSGQDLVQRGIQDPTQLSSVVPGFESNTNVLGTPVYTIRGIGFQDQTLAASPTVTVYEDEVPIPFSAETLGVALDLERLEVLKGPQGTLYGENATGGALNFIAAKPTPTLKGGLDASFGRFDTADVDTFISGPLGDTVNARLSMRALEGGNWQKSYTSAETLGQKNLLEGRLLLDWRPAPKLKISLDLNIWQDRSDSQAAQLIGIASLNNSALLPAFTTYPIAPHNDQAADWDHSRLYRQNNIFYMGDVRLDYDLTDKITLTSLTAYERYTRMDPRDGDGTALQDIYIVGRGSIDTVYQEVRLAGSIAGRGYWIAGVNYEADDTYDSFDEQFDQSTSSNLFGLPLSGTSNFTRQDQRTYGVFGNLDYDLTDKLNVQAGVRYTESDRSLVGCSRDNNGEGAAIFDLLQQILKNGSYVPIPVGGCINLTPVTFDPALATGELNESNVSWRVGLNWKAAPDTLIYGNISQGYKGGSFPTTSASSTAQFQPAKQENLIAYEAGFKSTLLADTLQFNGAVFYYDYSNKQILGHILDPIFGPLSALVNVPKSHVLGIELAATWKPVPGLTITPGFTYLYSRIDGNFTDYDSFGVLTRFSGEPFPYTPRAHATLDTEYDWRLNDAFGAFVGGNASYQSIASGALGDDAILREKRYALLDLRAGLEHGNWRFSLWGRNVTNTYYFPTAFRANDTLIRYTGMPATYGVMINFRY
jgi:iron complex outermembrane receptor protein